MSEFGLTKDSSLRRLPQRSHRHRLSRTVAHRVGGRPSRFHPVQIRYSAYPVYFQYVEDFWHSAFSSILYLYIVSFAYARLRLVHWYLAFIIKPWLYFLLTPFWSAFIVLWKMRSK